MQQAKPARDDLSLRARVLVEGSVRDVARIRELLAPEGYEVVERRELTDRLAASIEELERQRSSVLQLNQLKNDLIAVLAHDIKGPLTSISGFAELLEEGYLEGDAAIDAARTIRTNAQRLATLANDVLTLSRVEHGELEIADERVDLVDLIRTTAHGHVAERNITVSTSLPHAYVRGDAERLRQVFDNLFRNAIKYSPAGKPVDTIVDTDGENFRVRVHDHGIGIPAEELPRLFDRFARASNARKAKIAGAGIGLFIVKMIVERHGGIVTAESVLGKGSTFTVTLPSIDAPASRKPKRVSIVTGDADLSRFAAYELRSRGYRVRECRTLNDLAHIGDVRAGDVVVIDANVAAPDEVRKFAPHGAIRIIGLGADGTNGPWDAALARPFLVADLIAAVEGPATADLR
jgi:signal transduction histidine kinase